MGNRTKFVKVVKTITTTRTVRVVKTVRQGRIIGPEAIEVTLPEVEGVPEELVGTKYQVRRLLTDGSDNPKLNKSDKAGSKYRTYGITLSPARSSGYQVCASASAGCIRACLSHQGQARVFPTIKLARIAKTVAFFEHREEFERMLRHELRNRAKLGARNGFRPAIRPNILSDLMWERLTPWMFADFPGLQFYDYTKHLPRMLRWCSGELPPNYHLTFSRSERNHDDCLRVLEAGGNVTVVFARKPLPLSWRGYPVLDGDVTDMRFADPPGHVIGLVAKGTAKRDESGFVVGVMNLL